jgi:hypothetical protein
MDSDFVDEKEVSSSDDDNSDEEAFLRKIISQLKHEFLDEHLATDLVKRTISTVNTMMNRYAKMFYWFYKKIGNGGDVIVLQMLQTIVLRRFQLLTQYYKHLTENVLLKPSTISNINEEVAVLFNWFAIFRQSRYDTFSVQPTDLYSINLVIKAMRTYYSKERRLLSCRSVDNTVEGLIAARKWPVGGIPELHEAVLSQMHWARTVCGNPESLCDPTVYKHFCELMSASFYTGSFIAFESNCFY